MVKHPASGAIDWRVPVRLCGGRRLGHPPVPPDQHRHSRPGRPRVRDQLRGLPELSRRGAGRLVLRPLRDQDPHHRRITGLPGLRGRLGLHPAAGHRPLQPDRLDRPGRAVQLLRPAGPHRHFGDQGDLGIRERTEVQRREREIEQERALGIDVAVLHVPTIKPLDTDAILRAAHTDRLVVTMENTHRVSGPRLGHRDAGCESGAQPRSLSITVRLDLTRCGGRGPAVRARCTFPRTLDTPVHYQRPHRRRTSMA